MMLQRTRRRAIVQGLPHSLIEQVEQDLHVSTVLLILSFGSLFFVHLALGNIDMLIISVVFIAALLWLVVTDKRRGERR